MKRPKLHRLMHAIAQLSWRQRRVLQAHLAALQAREASIEAIESQVPGHCPSCGATHFVKNGFARGLQRFLCRGCASTFNALTGTPLSKLHLRGKWLAYAQALNQGLSIPQVAQQLDIAWSTAFRWRHRFLQLPSQCQASALHGIAEADESYFLDSCKGQRALLRKARRRGGKASKRGVSKEQVPVLMVRDRAGATANIIVARTSAAELSAALAPLLPKDTVLCTDSSSSLAAAARLLGVQHHSINVSAGIRVDGPWHVQNVNAYVSRLRGWMRRFKGVATKYLASYLGWFRMLDGVPGATSQPASVLVLAIKG